MNTTIDLFRGNPFGRNPLTKAGNGPLIDRVLEDGGVLNLLEELEALKSYTRSSSIEIPWPTPMHMLQSASISWR